MKHETIQVILCQSQSNVSSEEIIRTVRMTPPALVIYQMFAKIRSTVINVLLKCSLTLSGPGGGGGLKGPGGQTHSCQSETSYLMMPKLGEF